MGQYLRAVLGPSTWWLAVERGGGGGAGGWGSTYGRYLRAVLTGGTYGAGDGEGGGGGAGGWCSTYGGCLVGRGVFPGRWGSTYGQCWEAGAEVPGLAPRPSNTVPARPKYWRTNRTSYVAWVQARLVDALADLRRLLAQCVRLFGCLAMSCWPGFAEFTYVFATFSNSLVSS